MTQPFSLHDILLQKRVVSPQNLLAALEHQLVFGGRLGTNLVELGYIRLDDLGQILAVQFGVRHADINVLSAVDHTTLSRIPARFCIEPGIHRDPPTALNLLLFAELSEDAADRDGYIFEKK